MEKFEIGEKVTYTSPHANGEKDNGIIKSLTDSGAAAFVVYHCGGNWDNYQNYTGCHTMLKHLSKGWVEKEESQLSNQ